MGSDLRIDVTGIREFRAALKQLGTGAETALRPALNRGAQIVADDAARRVTKRTGRAARSVRARSTSTESRVVGGGKKVPYYGWLDFGGKVGKRGSVRRAVKKGGRYIYPAFHRKFPVVRRTVERALVQVARKARLL